jgi:hypothetical protein
VLSTSDTLAADGLGRAYVLVGGGFAEPSYAAVVDLQNSATLRHLPIASAGESVFALAGAPEGDRLFAGIWSWGDETPSSLPGQGRFVAIDTTSGAPLVRAPLAPESCVTDITLAAPPPGTVSAARRVVYAVFADQGPSRLGDDWLQTGTSYFLAAFDLVRLDPIAIWPLSERPHAVAVTPDGTRAYLLKTSPGWTCSLACLDLIQGAVTHNWPLPAASVAMALSATGRVYVADPFGDRLWRVDTRTNLLLTPLSIAGAPIALASV